MRSVPWIERMAPYAPPEDLEVVAAHAGVPTGEIIKLDANENPYGPSPRVREALAQFDGFHLYPDPDQRELRAAIAEYAGVDAGQTVGGGQRMVDFAAQRAGHETQAQTVGVKVDPVECRPPSLPLLKEAQHM